ncbi:hypothetical protein [Bradyrhizobium sp. Rc2d]|nr:MULTISPECIES: hypothetical protein [unclassified Bradyrhizobium]
MRPGDVVIVSELDRLPRVLSRC